MLTETALDVPALLIKMSEKLRDEGYLWTRAVMDRASAPATWHTLGNAVVAEEGRRPMAIGRGDGPVADLLVPMPVLHCHEVVQTPAIRIAIARTVRRLAVDAR